MTPVFFDPLVLASYDGIRIIFGFLLAIFALSLWNYFRSRKTFSRIQGQMLAGSVAVESWFLFEPLLHSGTFPALGLILVQLFLSVALIFLWYGLRRTHLGLLPKSKRRISTIVEFLCFFLLIVAPTLQILSLTMSVHAGLIFSFGLLAAQVGILSLSVRLFIVVDQKQHHSEENRDRAQRELTFIHSHDQLTGLLNRDSFFSRLDTETKNSSKKTNPLAFFYLDLDHFHEINDSMTNEAGNILLRSVAERIVLVMSDASSVFRTGEDEFAVVASCPHSQVDAAMIAEDLLAIFNKPFTINGSEVFLSASIGIAFLDPSESAIPGSEKLNRQLDQALAQAKLDHNTYRFFTPTLGERGLSSLQYVNYLRQAIDRHELSLHFQPQIDRTGALVSAEALLRWNNPELGSVPPSAFIPVAEEAGLIIPIGEWVMEHACAELAHWHSLGIVIPMAINLSTRQLKDIRLERSLLSKLKKYGLHPSYLHLEITESSLLEESERTIQTLINLSKAGFKLSIDDFGTGYANLSWLKRLPVSTVKIDRSFVVELPENVQDMALVQAMVDMAKSMGLSIIAEGVESLRQLEVLRAAECSIIQGFFYSRPLPSIEFVAFARAKTA